MEVDNSQYKRQLLSILKHIANATFVTFDLEMSGISTRRQYGTGDRSQKVDKPTLQEIYEEMKDAASTYQVVQFGITCIEEDREKEFYLARPYNFYLSPLQAAGVDIRLERDFTFSSSACEFLLKNDFNFGTLFKSGVPYLSRTEEDVHREEYQARTSRTSTIPDLIIPASDTTNLTFYRKARSTISEWINSSKPEFDFVNVGSVLDPTSGYQRRLIYQLIRSEFPGLRAFPRGGKEFMQVVKVDVKREAEFQKRKDESFEAGLAKQIGLRWIFEALSGGNLDGINPRWFYVEGKDGDETKPENQLDAIVKDVEKVKLALLKKQHIIVGHNLFTDLGFLYNTFVGILPEKVSHFQEEIHELFPRVFDTKYIATHGREGMGSSSALAQLLEPFKSIHEPLVVLHEKHTSYGSGKDHEAGFDSWMTAELFVKLTSTLFEERRLGLLDANIENSDLDSSCDDDVGGVTLNVPDTDGGFFSDSESGEGNVPAAWHAVQLNRFSVLADGGGEDKIAETTTTVKPSPFMPPIKSSFWDVYVNKLRVNAAEGGICHLATDE
ncbi:Ribonuclease H-like protein [Glarea lozoyensis ATCC 20868]|uniref:Ribonuclease H-like protein n=1 Tax=Glarea lozoyensis (strain ATCC 20868 / MF5171) TaxID=1116229 RepID=S3CQV1_GLAL2|nr:Ribonuclease H-like protein [Glarea lozoyensis ATCC 20868]EPE28802.1 Ribonuclease H-like protein [Glarea lozoyensis ATCC 20868]